MELAKLILEYVKVLSWPSVVLVLILMFRAHLKRLLDRLISDTEEFSALGVSARFRQATVGEQARRLKEEAEAVENREKAERVEKAEEAGREATRPEEKPQVTEGLRAPIDRYFIAEELVLRALEARWATPIQRQAILDLGGGRLVHADGVAETPNGLTIVEVKLLTNRLLPESVLEAIAMQASAVERHFKKPVTAHLALATTLHSEDVECLTDAAREKVASMDVRVIIEVFRLDQLMKSMLGVRDEGS